MWIRFFDQADYRGCIQGDQPARLIRGLVPPPLRLDVLAPVLPQIVLRLAGVKPIMRTLEHAYGLGPGARDLGDVLSNGFPDHESFTLAGAARRFFELLPLFRGQVYGG